MSAFFAALQSQIRFRFWHKNGRLSGKCGRFPRDNVHTLSGSGFLFFHGCYVELRRSSGRKSPGHSFFTQFMIITYSPGIYCVFQKLWPYQRQTNYWGIILLFTVQSKIFLNVLQGTESLTPKHAVLGWMEQCTGNTLNSTFYFDSGIQKNSDTSQVVKKQRSSGKINLCTYNMKLFKC